MAIADFITFLAIGLIAGFIGTAVMTLSQIFEMRRAGRAPSFTPAVAASRVFGFDLAAMDETKKTMVNTLVHWSYGALWGIPLIFIALFKLGATVSIALYFLTVWAQRLVIVPLLAGGEPLWQQGAKQIAIDFTHHLVYALASALVAFFLLDFLIGAPPAL